MILVIVRIEAWLILFIYKKISRLIQKKNEDIIKLTI